jgi:hypothetical protein
MPQARRAYVLRFTEPTKFELPQPYFCKRFGFVFTFWFKFTQAFTRLLGFTKFAKPTLL